MLLRKSVSLFDGEVVIGRSGIYTFVHYYRHSDTGHEVVIVGMNHVGDEIYYNKIKQILASCDLVLFENIRKEKDERCDQDVQEAGMRLVVFGSNIEEAFFTALQLHFTVAGKFFSLKEKEEEVFDSEYCQHYWFSGDMSLGAKEGKQIEENINLAFQAIEEDEKKGVVDYVREAIERMDRGEFAKQDIADSFIVFYSSLTVLNVILKTLAEPRDLHCFNEFDRLVREKNPRKIGIKFGAGHISFQRLLLEKRGYVLQKSQKLCNISFKN